MTKTDDGGSTLIRMDGAVLGYGRPLLGPLDLAIRKGDFWGVVGPNGAGKTTLIKSAVGLVPLIGGTLSYPGGKPAIGYVPQHHSPVADYPLTALDVVLMGLTSRLVPGRSPGQADRDAAMVELARVSMEGESRRRFSILSGGQKQRVLMARALASGPELLVLDEPSAGMDLPGETDLLRFLETLHRDTGLTIMMISHQLGKVLSVVDHLCLMNCATGMFEAGPLGDVLDAGRLSAAYGREVEVGSFMGDVLVRVKAVGND